MDYWTLIGLIIGLIPLYQRGKDKRNAADKEDFYAWLIRHQFDDVKNCITNNFALEVEIEKLLKQNHAELLNRFDYIDNKILQVLSNVEEFKSIVTAIAPSAILSEQAEKILQTFVKSQADVMQLRTLYETGSQLHLSFDSKPCNLNFDQRFIERNLQTLTNAGYIIKIAESSYQLDESAIEYVNHMKDNQLSEEGLKILKLIVESDKHAFWIMPTMNSLKLLIGNLMYSYESDLRMYIEELISHGFIKQSVNPDKFKTQYILKIEGENYIKNMNK